MKKSILPIMCLFISTFGCVNNPEQTNDVAQEETHRPQFHFTPPSGWMNDPNGMVYHNGEYHLFYQHNPDSTIWGPMHWGHAVSPDMVYWEHLPIGLYPDSLGTIFSGSAVVDVNNTSGLGTGDNPPMVAIFTYHNTEAEEAGRDDFQTQGIAFSLDNGRSWTKYSMNPVLPNPGIRDFRDPKVMWYEEGQKWIMVLAVADHISFYSSPDLKGWQLESDFGNEIGAHGGVWECPDLFQLSVEGTNEKKWVLLVSINPGGPNGGSATQYFVGEFDGSNFTLDEEFEADLNKSTTDPVGKLFADFEGSTYNSWKLEGDAFGQQPVSGSIGNQQKVSGFTGSRLINSFREGDKSTGKLISPSFTINSDYINLLIGGGEHPEATAVNLLVGNELVGTATGNNSETLEWKTLPTKDVKGKEARIEIIDNETGGWGHILVDQIMFADAPAVNIEEGIWLDYGTDNYAGVTWSDIPEEDGRRLFMGWMSNWLYANVVPTESWRSAMTVARSLTLENTEAGLRLISRPVDELEKLRIATHELEEKTISGSWSLSETVPFTTSTFGLELELIANDGQKGFAIELSNELDQKVLIGFDADKNQYYVDRTKAGPADFSAGFSGIHYAPRLTSGNSFSVKLLVDVASVELFADGGKTVMTDIFFPEEVFTRVRVIPAGGELRVSSGMVYDLKSIYAVQ